jgi:uncharacterized protein (TIGR03437 family)
MGPDRGPRFLTKASVRVSARTISSAAWLATASCLLSQVPGYTIATVAGKGNNYPRNGVSATSVYLFYPSSLAIDAVGNLYIADAVGAIWKVSSSGILSIAAGWGPTTMLGDGGPAASAWLNSPTGVAVDAAGNIYIADSGHNRIRKVMNGTITTVVGSGSPIGALGDGGPATTASLASPTGLALDSIGTIYIADSGHNRIRKVTPDGTITTIAGIGPNTSPLGDGGPATSAWLDTPTGVAVDTAGNVYIADCGNNRIRKVTPAGTITTVAGNGISAYSGDGGLAINASISSSFPDNSGNRWLGVALDGAGNLYIADYLNDRVRLVTNDGKINTIAAGLGGPSGIALGSGGRIYVSEMEAAASLLTPSGIPVFPPPSIEFSGVFSATDFGSSSHLALGSWVEIHGSYLASNSRSWAGTDFSGTNAPTSLDGTSVTIGGQHAYISYISPGQVNAQVPTSIGTGAQPLIVTTRNGESAAYAVTVDSVAPSLLAPTSFDIATYQYAVALFPDNATYVLPSGAIAGVPSRPAKAGDTITLYGVGFGAVMPNIPAGQIVLASNSLAMPLILQFGSTEATVTYAGQAPGAIGLYQFNVIVPKLSATGPVPLSFTVGGLSGMRVLFVSVQ